MRLLLLLLLLAPTAAAQWTRVDTNYGLPDTYATNLVTGTADHLFAAVLAGQPVPDRYVVLRSPDDGDAWEEVFSGYNGGARGHFFGDLGGVVTLLVRGNGESALLRSSDGGATWAETAARVPSATLTGAARVGATYVVVGGSTSYRSTDDGATWAAFGSGQPMGSVVAFGGAFYAGNGIGQVFRLEGDAWTPVSFGAPFASHLWVDGGRLWAKASVGALYASPDGATWAAQPTAEPAAWGRSIPAAGDGSPWFLHVLTFGQDLFLSPDDGASATSIADGYPRDDNGALCTSNFAVTATAVVGNAWACSFTQPERNGVYRYALGATAAEAAPEAAFALTVAPNPVAGAAAVRLALPASGPVHVAVYDALGRTVAVLHEGPLVAGRHAFPTPATLPAGVYLVRVRTHAAAAARTFTVVR